jgi:hypothetical protein
MELSDQPHAPAALTPLLNSSVGLRTYLELVEGKYLSVPVIEPAQSTS